MKNHIKFAACVAMLFLHGHTGLAKADDCTHFTKRMATDFDGPGAFGELQDTVTLACLKYVGSIGQAGDEQVLIQDDRGKIHRMRVGSYMGEYTGVIEKIDDDFIYIAQSVPQSSGAFRKVLVKFPRKREQHSRKE